MRHKSCSNLQSLPVLTHQWKHFLIDFVTGLPISINWKKDNYDSILAIVDWVTKMVHYKPIKITINALKLAKVIIEVIVCHHGILDSIVTNKSSFFTWKFWSLLCYFLGIKRRLFTPLNLQIDGQTKKQNSIIKGFFQAFVNFKQNDWAKLLSMAKFAYNNAKNTNTRYTLFELNCGYNARIFFKENIDPFFQLKSADELSVNL